MNKIKNRLTKMSSQEGLNFNKEYDYEKNLNWKDDGDSLDDPSINDYNKGYKIDPYKFEQWAKKKGFKLTKTAAEEQIDMHFFPEYLADEILTLWNGSDGPLQNFFDAFCLRYDNKMKKAIAELITKKGYKVYPTLTDDIPRYAKHKSIFKKVLASKNPHIVLEYGKMLFPKSIALKKLAEEIKDLKDSGHEVLFDDYQGILDYYKLIYPEDYAIALIEVIDPTVDNHREDSKFEKFKDYDISDESLDQMEKSLSENQDPIGKKDNGFGDFSYDYLTDSRHDGTMPQDYEFRLSKKSKKKN